MNNQSTRIQNYHFTDKDKVNNDFDGDLSRYGVSLPGFVHYSQASCVMTQPCVSCPNLFCPLQAMPFPGLRGISAAPVSSGESFPSPFGQLQAVRVLF